MLDAGDPDSHADQSGILSALDGIQLRQPVRDCLPLLLPLLSVARVPPDGSTRVIGAYDEDSIKWIELPPCIVGKAPSLHSHEQVPPAGSVVRYRTGIKESERKVSLVNLSSSF